MERILKLQRLYAAYIIPATLANSFIALYLVSVLKMGPLGLLLFLGAAYGVSPLVIFFQRSFSPRTSFLIAGAALAAEYLLLAFPANEWQVWLASLLYGFVLCHFWMVFNGLYFKEQAHTWNATRSAVYYAILYVSGMAIPLAGIAVIGYAGFSGLYLASAVAVLPFLYFALREPPGQRRIDFRLNFPEAKGYRTLTLLEGAISAMPLALVPLATTLFFPTPEGFGGFSAFISLAAVVAMILLAKKSDALNVRKKFMVPLNAATGLAALAVSLVTGAFLWAVAGAVFSFLNTLSLPLRNAVVLDKESDPAAAMANREFLLNIGRVGCIAFSAVILAVTGSIQFALLPGALALFAYAAVLKLKKWVS